MTMHNQTKNQVDRRGVTGMPEKVLASMNRMREAMERLPQAQAEKIARDAAIRAEAMAEYAEYLAALHGAAK